MKLLNSLKQLEKILPESYNLPEDKLINKFKFDSRDVKEGDVFIALKAERDGHQFTQSALLNGAVGCIVDNYNPDLAITQFVVQDTWESLNHIAQISRDYYKGKVIAITGSCGKTTVKEMLSSVLNKNYATYKNFNGLLGLPITLANLDHESKYAILEMGTDHSGNINKLTKLAQPNIAIVTSIGKAHLEHFETLDNIAKEKLSIANGLQENGVLIIPHEYYSMANNTTDHKILTISLDDTDATCYTKKISGNIISAVINNKEISFKLKENDDHKLLNTLAVLCVIDQLDLSLEGRGQKINLKNNNLLIDESYNANPLSMQKTLESFANKETKNKKMAILGDMLELGAEEEIIAHRSLARECTDFHTIYTAGPLMHHLHQKLDPRNHDIQHFANSAELIEYLSTLKLKDFDIFAKGSNGSKIHEVVKFLKQEYKI